MMLLRALAVVLLLLAAAGVAKAGITDDLPVEDLPGAEQCARMADSREHICVGVGCDKIVWVSSKPCDCGML